MVASIEDYSAAIVVPQMVKDIRAMQEIQV